LFFGRTGKKVKKSEIKGWKEVSSVQGKEGRLESLERLRDGTLSDADPTTNEQEKEEGVTSQTCLTPGKNDWGLKTSVRP